MAVNGLTQGDESKIPPEIALLNPLFAELSYFGVGAESYHPNQNGHQLIEKRILELTNGNLNSFRYCSNEKNICPSGRRSVPAPDSEYWGESAMHFADLYEINAEQELPKYPQNLTMIVKESFSSTARQFSVGLRRLEPGSPAVFTLNSEPIYLGTYTVDAGGELNIDIAIPSDIEAGPHTLNVETKNELGEDVWYYQEVVAYDADSLNSPCTFVELANKDIDDDGIDDACDGFYEQSTDEKPIQNDPGDTQEVLSASGKDLVITIRTPDDQKPLSVIATDIPSTIVMDTNPKDENEPGETLGYTDKKTVATTKTSSNANFGVWGVVTALKKRLLPKPRSRGQSTALGVKEISLPSKRTAIPYLLMRQKTCPVPLRWRSRLRIPRQKGVWLSLGTRSLPVIRHFLPMATAISSSTRWIGRRSRKICLISPPKSK